MKKYYKLGNLEFAITGGDDVLPFVEAELASIRVDDIGDPLLEFHFGTVNTSIPNGVIASSVICSESEMIYEDQSFVTHVCNQGRSYQMIIGSKKVSGKRGALPALARLVHWNFLSPTEELAKNFMYDTFDYITQIINVTVKQSYFHASSFEKDGRGVALVAWSGIGKTTAMLKLVNENGWSFLSDDFGIVDEDGYLYRSPKKVQVYAYNLLGQEGHKKMLLADRKALDLLNWHYRSRLLGVDSVRRRTSAEQLFGSDAVGKKAKLSDVFFIERAMVSKISSATLSPIELARRAAYCVMKEIEPYHKIASAIYSVQSMGVIPPYELLYEQTKQTLERAFAGTQPILVKLPMDTTPDELVHYIKVQLGEKH